MVTVYPLMLQSEIYDLLNELFLSTEIWGWIGPTALVIASLYLIKRDYFLGLLMIIVLSLFTYTYFELISTNGNYVWHSFITVMGIITCIFTMISKQRR